MTIAEISINNLPAGADTAQYDLLLAVAPGFFAYTIADTENRIVLFEKFAMPVQGLGSFNPAGDGANWLNRNYRKVKVAYFSAETITMPSKLYNPAGAGEQLDFVYGDTGEDILLNDFINHRSLYCLYRVQKELVRAVARQFPLASAWHTQSLLLSQKTGESSHDSLHISFLADACSFMLHKNGQLCTVKSFSFSHVPDVAFNLLAFCQLHGVDAANVQLTAGGWINSGSPIHEELRKYFLHTSFATYPELPNGFEQFAPHFFELFYLLQTV